MLRLINARPSPYGRKVAIALHEKGVSFETIFDLPWAEAVETRRHSPLEQLPILLVDDEEPVYDSSFILQWIEARYPKPALLPAKAAERLDALKLQMLGERLMEVAQGLVFESFRPQPSGQAVERATRKIVGGLAEAERLVGESPAKGEPVHLGHIALGTTLCVWEFIVKEGMCPAIDAFLWRGRYPRLTRLMEQLEQRPSFKATRPQLMAVNIAAEVA